MKCQLGQGGSRSEGLAQGCGSGERAEHVWSSVDSDLPDDVLKVGTDEDGVGGDDAADCVRYLVATKARGVVQRKLRGL